MVRHLLLVAREAFGGVPDVNILMACWVRRFGASRCARGRVTFLFDQRHLRGFGVRTFRDFAIECSRR
jgi:hypothetical protein